MSQLRRWAIDIIKDFTTVDMYKHKIALLTVHNTKAELPKDFKKVISIAYRTFKNKKDCTLVEDITEYTQKSIDGCEIKISCDKCLKDTCTCKDKCDKDAGLQTIEIDIDRIWMMENPWYYDVSRYSKPHDTRELYKDSYRNEKGGFKLMAAATNPYFNVNTHIPDCVNLRCDECERRYTIHPDTNVVETDIIEPNAELLIAYLAVQSSSDGDLLIPDNTNAVEAIEYQLSYKYYRMKFAKTGDRVFQTLYSEAAQRRDIAVGRLKVELSIPDADVLRANLSQIMKRPKTQAPTRTYSDKLIQHIKY